MRPLPFARLLAVAALALVTLAGPAAAQSAWTDAFAVPGAYGGGTFGASVNAAVADGAGTLVGGEFRLIDGVAASGVARWTGTAWETLGGGLGCTACADGFTPGRVNAVVRDAAGAVWAAGYFDTAVQPDGTALAVSGLARWTGAAWDAPGRLTGGAFGSGPSGFAIQVQGASVIIGGDFFDVLRPDGTSVGSGNVARWTGGAWAPMAQSGIVYALAESVDGRTLSAGTIALPDGRFGTAVEAWDGAAWQPVTGALDSEFAIVRAIRAEPGGLFVGGGFEGGRAADGSLIASRGVIRWDGAAWQPLGRGVAGPEVRALSRDAAGLLVGGILDGGFDALGSAVASPALVRWTGSAWQAVPGGEGRRTVDALAPLGAETLVGGRFAMRSGLYDETRRASNLAVLAPGGTQRPLSRLTGRDGTFYADGSGRLIRLAADGCGGVHVYAPEGAGPLQSDATPNRRWSGTAWLPVPLALVQTRLAGPAYTEPYVAPYVSDIAGDPASCSAFVVGGQIRGALSYTGARVESAGVIRWDGTAWRPLGRGVVGEVRAVDVAPDGAVVAGGGITAATQADGTAVPVAGVARWTQAGGWAPLGGGLRSTGPAYLSGAFAVLAEAGGAAIVSGGFDAVAEADGTARPANGVARWTGAAWETFGGPLPLFGFPASVSALVRWNGLIVVGGGFTSVAQPSGEAIDARAVAAWDGTAWRALPGLDYSVSGLAVAGGELFTSDGLGQRAARWTGATWVPLGADPPSAIEIAGSGRSLYLAGGFETAGGIPSPALARFDLDAVVAAEAPAVGADAALAAFPNPARGAATLRVRLDAPGHARLTLLDALGRTVAVLLDGEQAAGEQTVRVDTARLPAGVYAARLDAGGRVRTARLTVVR